MADKEKPNVSELTQDGLKLIVQGTKTVHAMPSGNSRELYNSHATFRRIVEDQSKHILEIIATVVRTQGIRGNIVNRRDPEEKFELLQECNDAVLERVNSNLDDLFGIRKSPETVAYQQELLPEKRHSLNSSWNRSIDKSVGIKAARLLTAKNVARPQASFKIPVDNSTNAWSPRIKYKPNSIKPLAVLPEYDDDNQIFAYTHPYEIELDRFEPSEENLKEKAPVPPLPIESTELVYIDAVGDLKKALSEFEAETELAIDLEHHSYRTFQGITCLMQISTRKKDYIIDTIALREDLHILNEVFTRPTITKVLHGADMDIEWLQRDLSLYIVNLFDTHQAAKRLGFARLSLAYLLKHFCQIEADKTFQLADWRMRPLPEELIDYARQDTHFLLFIYDNLRNELLKNGISMIKGVYESSKEICLKRYFKPLITPNSYMDVYRKSKKAFNNRQLFALRNIFEWRDKIARQEDESYGYVLPNHMMLHISEALPREMQGILACCNPIPPLVKQHLHVLHQIILRAREQSLVKPIEQDLVPVNRESTISNFRDYENPLYCPHDLLQSGDDAQLPCLLDKKNQTVDSESNHLIAEPCVSAFTDVINSVQDGACTVAATVKKMTFITPYQRYKLYLPYAREERKQQEMQEKKVYTLEKPMVAEKHKLDQEPEEEDVNEVRQAFKKRKLEARSGVIKSTLKIFNSEKAEDEEEAEKLDAIIEELAQSKLPRKNFNINPIAVSRNLIQPSTSIQHPQENKNSDNPANNNKKKMSKSQRRKAKRLNAQTKSQKKPKNVNSSPQNTKQTQQFKRSQPAQSVQQQINLSNADFSRFGGGSKPLQRKQFEISQKFKGKGNRNRYRGNYMNASH